MSRKVFQVEPESKIMGKLRLYSHCGVINASLVVFGLNMENCTRKILLDMTEESKTICSYNFTPTSANYEGKVIHPKYYKYLRKDAHQSHLGRQKMVSGRLACTSSWIEIYLNKIGI